MSTQPLDTLAELQQAEGMAWAELHAIQGRIAECQFWINQLADPIDIVGVLEQAGFEVDDVT